MDNSISLVKEYSKGKSGGDRIEVLATSLFKVIGEKFSIYDEIKRKRVNASDISSGLLADIECWSKDRIVLLVEVKDRDLHKLIANLVLHVLIK